MNHDELRTLVAAIIAPINDHFMGQQKALRDRIAALEADRERVAALEADRMEYTGVHESGREYRRGQIVTHEGSMWFCKATTRTQPPGDHWQCCVKRGRDAR